MWGSKQGIESLKASLANTTTQFVHAKKVPETRIFHGGEDATKKIIAEKASSVATAVPEPQPEGAQGVTSVESASEKKTVGKLVLDAGAFISGVKLDAFGPDCEYYTIAEVVDELKDEATLNRFKNFPYPIVVKKVSDSAMKYVNYASKATGDYYALSNTDRKVIALAYQLEVETHGFAHVKQTIPKPIEVTDTKGINAKEKKKTVTELTEADVEVDESDETLGSIAQSGPVLPFSLPLILGATKEQFFTALGVELDSEGRPITFAELEPEVEALHGDDVAEALVAGAGKKFIIPGFDDGQWITPDNVDNITSKTMTSAQASVKQTAAKPSAAATLLPAPISEQGPQTVASVTLTSSGSSVACITTDYAMQNVLLQAGLRILSANGYAVTTLQQFMMGCHGCYSLSRDMGRGFCGTCGGYTMVRVSINIDKKGNVRYRWPAKKIYNTRGTVYNIPKMKGGKRNNDLILREDMMPKPKLRDLKAAAEPTPDLFSEGTEFAFNLVTPTTQAVFGYGRRNPNEVRKH